MAAKMIVLLAAVVVAAHGQEMLQMQGIQHPAAGPDFGQPEITRALFDGSSLLAPEDKSQEGIVDPDGRKLVSALKPLQSIRQEQLRREQEEIARILAEDARSRAGGKALAPSLSTWLWALFGCSLVVACGVVPAFLLPANSSEFLHTPEGKRKLNLMLSFAVGSLLGDVFLHLLPETWDNAGVDTDAVGLWTIAGLVMCFVVEKICASTEDSQHQVCAIMNLIGNLVDNFTHGLAVGASFLVGVKFGLLTTFAILIHEIPHEVSDFAILLRADYDRVSAVKAQILTASGGVLGACAALYLQSESALGVSWMLPFTAGGFINIALAQILPELLQETNQKQSLKQLMLILAGIATMSFINQLHLAL